MKPGIAEAIFIKPSAVLAYSSLWAGVRSRLPTRGYERGLPNAFAPQKPCEWKMRAELQAQKYLTYIFEDLWAALADDAVQPVRTSANEAIAGSCCIVCTNGIHQGTFERLASGHFPFVFNNTCLSWREIAASFLDAGCRGYLGTLWSAGTDTPSEAAAAHSSEMR